MEVPHVIVLSKTGGVKKEKHWNSFREKEVN